MSFNECENLLSSYELSNKPNSNFFEFVYNKISKDTKNRFVDKNKDSIDIIPSNYDSIKVIPLYKDMDSQKLFLDYEVNLAVEIINKGIFKNIYFVYPKNENFKKHIEVKVPHLEQNKTDYLIKIIPYSLNSLKRKQHTCSSGCSC